VITGLSAALVVLLPYLWITAQYPAERQLQDSYFSFFNDREDFALLVHDRTRDLRACAHHFRPLKYCLADVAIFLADKPLLRAWDEYLLGLGDVVLHARYGHVVPTYFLGEVSFSAHRQFFPVAYFIKETLPFHILTALALLLAVTKVWASSWGIRSIIHWVRSHPAETLMLGWLILYWSAAINANLNIGVRHLLPVFPFTIILVSREINQWLRLTPGTFARSLVAQRMKQMAVILLLIWQLGSVLRIYPAFLAYFNEAVGGPKGGASYVVDSDLDWGQDLRRLRTFVEVHRIDKIAVDYHGRSSPRYELGDKFIPWESAQGPYRGWIAVSATVLKKTQGRWDPIIEDKPKPEDSYAWLQGRKPVAKIGYSIFVFDLRDSI
jgi:hypothetical protein